MNQVMDFLRYFLDDDDIILSPRVKSQNILHVSQHSHKKTFREVRDTYRHLNYCIGSNIVPHNAIPAICQRAGLDYQAEVAKVIARDLATGESALSEMVRNAVIVDAKRLFDPLYKVDKLVIHHKLSTEEEATLTEIFPELNLEFKHDMYHPHAFAAASRIIEEQINIMGLGLNRIANVKVPEEYDALVKDSGGDAFKQISRGRHNFHCCSPILSIYDQQRDANRKASIATMQKCSDLQRKALKKYNDDVINGTSVFFCNNVSEQCHVKAPFMTFLHSTYDRTATDIANAMTAADVKVGTGSFIFCTEMLLNSEGIIKSLGAYYKIFTKDGVKYINMSFKGDPSWSYTHRVDTYLTLLQQPVIKDSNGQHYFVNISSIRNSIVFFRIVKCGSKNVLPGQLTHRLWFENSDNMVIQCFDWLADGYDTSKNHMRLVRFEAPKRLVNDAINYAYTLDHNKFSVTNILAALKCFSTRVVGTKAVSQQAYDMEPKKLYLLASAIFLKCFVDRFGITKATSEVTDEIQRLRSQKGFNALNIIKNLWEKFISPKIPKPNNDKNLIYEQSVDNPGHVPLEGVPALNLGTRWYRKFMSTLIEWSAVPQKYPVHISEAVQFVEITTIIESDYTDLERNSINYLPCFPLIDEMNPFRESPLSDEACDIVEINDNKDDKSNTNEVPNCGEDENDKSQKCSEQKPTENVSESKSSVTTLSECSNVNEEFKKDEIDLLPDIDDLVRGEAIGDGNCLFDSLRQLLDDKLSIKEFKLKLLKSTAIADIPAILLPEIVKVLLASNEWGGEPEILLASKAYGVRIIVYADHLSFKPRVYGTNEKSTIFLHLVNQHYTPCRLRRFLPKSRPTFVIDDNSREINKTFEINLEKITSESTLSITKEHVFDEISETMYKSLPCDKFTSDRDDKTRLSTVDMSLTNFVDEMEIDESNFNPTRSSEWITFSETFADDSRDVEEDFDSKLKTDFENKRNVFESTRVDEIEESYFNPDSSDQWITLDETFETAETDTESVKAELKSIQILNDDKVSDKSTSTITMDVSIVDFSKKEITPVPHKNKFIYNMVTEVNAVVYQTNIAVKNFFDILEPEKILPSVDVTGGVIRIFGKPKRGSKISSKSNIKVKPMRGILKQTKTTAEIISMTSAGTTPVYNKEQTCAVACKKFKKSVGFKVPNNLNDKIEDKRETPIVDNSNNSTTCTDEKDRPDNNRKSGLVDEELECFVKNLRNRQRLCKDYCKLITIKADSNKILNTPYMIHNPLINVFSEKRYDLNFMDMPSNADTIINIFKLVDKHKKILQIDLRNILSEENVTSRVDILKTYIPVDFQGIVEVYTKFDMDHLDFGDNEPKETSVHNGFWKSIFSPRYPVPDHKPEFIKEKTPSHSAVNAMIEIRELWKTTVGTAKATYSTAYLKLTNPLSVDTKRYLLSHKEKFSVFDRFTQKWLLNSEPNVDYSFCYDGSDFVDFESKCDENATAASKDRLLLCGRYTVLMQEPNLINATKELKCLQDKFTIPKIDMVVGVPGCGKTTFIINEHKPGSLVLTSSSEGAADIRERLSKKYNQPLNDFKESYRTIDSYILNSKKTYNEVWIDEALMKHPGEIFLVCLYSECEVLHLLGDPNQIGYINRLGSVSVTYGNFKNFFKPSRVLDTSYRCPVDVMALLYDKYETGTKSTSKVIKSLKTKPYTSLANVPLDNKTFKYLVFKQSEKDVLRRAGYDVSTIHEYQGKQAKNIVIVRTSTKVKEEIYNSDSHILVAISRHTESLIYYTPVRDSLKAIIEKPIDSKLIEKVQLSMRGGATVGFRQRPTVSSDCVHVNTLTTKILDVCNIFIDTIDEQDPIEIPIYSPVTKLNVPSDINSLMFYHDLLLPGNSYHYHYMDAVNMLNNDIDVELDDICIIESRRPPKLQRYDKLRPVLQTMMPCSRRPSQIESIIALNKRNMAVPELDGMVDPHALGERLITQFMTSYVDEDNVWMLNEFKINPIKPNSEIIEDWLKTQDTSIRNLLDGPDYDLTQWGWSKYKFMIKPTVKPTLDTTAPHTNNALQTIACQEKFQNAVFCPIFREMDRRFELLYKKNFKVFTRVTNEDIRLENPPIWEL